MVQVGIQRVNEIMSRKYIKEEDVCASEDGVNGTRDGVVRGINFREQQKLE